MKFTEALSECRKGKTIKMVNSSYEYYFETCGMHPTTFYLIMSRERGDMMPTYITVGMIDSDWMVVE